eukprot:scaffold1948_cov52-Attheya_sp.AAC.5
MRVKELKAELSQRNISTGDVFEKDELVKRLFEARRAETTSTETSGSQSATGKEKTTPTASSSVTSTETDVSVPLSFYSMESGKSVAAKNGQNVFLRPSPGQFATMQIKVGSHTASLLVDTACSGIVLRPNVVRAMGLQILPSPISMTTAGGTASDVGMAQIPIMSVRSVDNQEYNYKSLPVAVQDIGALPSQLDGIIGLSFLSQFACVEFDFRKSWLNLFKMGSPSSTGSSNDLSVVAQAKLSRTPIGVWTADVMLDGRGPVKMLVDTGASSSILNWKGVADMGLSRTSNGISPIATMGAMGADNMALALTHRFTVQRRYNLVSGSGSSSPGVPVGDRPANVDVGDIPVLAQLQSSGVGGILGADLLMRCDMVRLNMNGASPQIILLKE